MLTKWVSQPNVKRADISVTETFEGHKIVRVALYQETAHQESCIGYIDATGKWLLRNHDSEPGEVSRLLA